MTTDGKQSSSSEGRSDMSPVTSFTASLGHNGLIDIFALALDPQLPPGQGVTVWRSRQTAPDGRWSAWVSEGKPGNGAVGVRSITGDQGRGHVLAHAGGAHLWFKERGSADAFSAWQHLGIPPADAPHDDWGFIYMWGATGAGGQIDVVGTANSDRDRAVFHRFRPAPGAAWSAWSRLPGDNDFDGDIVAATDYHGGLDIITPIDVIGQQGQEIGLSHRRRGADGTWTDWMLLDHPPGGFRDDITPVLTTGSDSPLGLELLGVSTSNTIWHTSQTTGGGWSDWASLGSPGGTVTGIAVTTGPTGGLDLCATLQDNTVAHRRQEGQGGPWSAWTSLGRPDTSAIAMPALILDSRKCLNLLMSRPGKEGMITLRQKTPDGTFVKGPILPALPPH
jgi:hypothetical protein